MQFCSKHPTGLFHFAFVVSHLSLLCCCCFFFWFAKSTIASKIICSENKYCPRTNIRTYSCAKQRLCFTVYYLSSIFRNTRSFENRRIDHPDIPLGRVVRKPVNVNPRLNVNWSAIFSCLKMFFISNVWCSLRLLQLKTAGQTYKQNTSLKSYKTKIKILANPRLV